MSEPLRYFVIRNVGSAPHGPELAFNYDPSFSIDGSSLGFQKWIESRA